jgi:hypothetical protein
MSTHVKSDADEEGGDRSTTPAVAFASIWAYALAAGFVALGITHGIPAIVHPRYLRVPLQWATIPIVALLAGLACENALMRIHHRSLLVCRSDDEASAHRS